MKQLSPRRLLVVLGVMLSLTSARAETVTLATSGTPTKKIAIPIAASGSLVATGSSMRVFLNRITGGTFTSTTYDPSVGPPSNCIVLGTSDDLNMEDVLPNDDPVDDKLKTENFIVATGTTTNNIVIVGASDLAVSHGVYELLQQLGCRWFFPGNDWEVVPSNANLSWTTPEKLDDKIVEMGNVTMEMAIYFNEEPDYKSRYIWYSFNNASGGNNAGEWKDNYKDSVAWNIRNRNIKAFKINSAHSYANIVQWAKSQTATDATSDPVNSRWRDEYFAEVGGIRGTPSDTDSPALDERLYQLCVTNTNVQQLVRDYADAYFTDHPTEQTISLEPNDGTLYWCDCTTNFGGSGTGGCHGFSTWSGSNNYYVTDRVVMLANLVAADHPDKTVGILAYAKHAGAPSIAPLPNVNVQIANGYHTHGMNMPKLLKGWTDAFASGSSAPNLGVYDYFTLYGSDQGLPITSKSSDILYVSSTYGAWHTGTGKAYTYEGEASYSMGMGGLGQYIALKKLWNVDVDAVELRHDFLEKCFGEDNTAIYDTMDDFYNRLDRSIKTNKMSSDYMGRLFALLQDAYTETSDAAVEKRLDALTLYLRYVDLRRTYESLPLPTNYSTTLAPSGTDTTRKNNLQDGAVNILKHLWLIRKTNMVDSQYAWKYTLAFGQNAANENKDMFDWPTNSVTWPDYGDESWAPGTLNLDAGIPGVDATVGLGGVMERQPWKISDTSSDTYDATEIADMITYGIANNPLLEVEARVYDQDLVVPGFAATTRGSVLNQFRLHQIALYVRTSSSATLPTIEMGTGFVKDKGDMIVSLVSTEDGEEIQTATVVADSNTQYDTGTISGTVYSSSHTADEIDPLVFTGSALDPNTNYMLTMNDFDGGTKMDWTASSQVSMVARSDWPYDCSGGQRRYFYIPKGVKKVGAYAKSMSGNTNIITTATTGTQAIIPSTTTGTNFYFDVPSGYDGKVWYFQAINTQGFFFHNIPGVLAANSNELLLPKEAFPELIPSLAASGTSRGNALDFEDKAALYLYGTGTSLPELTITPAGDVSPTHVWKLYDDDGTTVLQSGTITSFGFALPLTFSTTFTNTRTCLFVYDDLDVGGPSHQIEWDAGKKVSECANIEHPGNGWLVDRRFFFVPKGTVSFSYSADAMLGGTFYTASGSAKHTQANTGGEPTGVVTIDLVSGEDDQIWYLGTVGSGTDTAGAKNLVFNGIPGHLARRPDELLIPRWTFMD